MARAECYPLDLRRRECMDGSDSHEGHELPHEQRQVGVNGRVCNTRLWHHHADILPRAGCPHRKTTRLGVFRQDDERRAAIIYRSRCASLIWYVFLDTGGVLVTDRTAHAAALDVGGTEVKHIW